VRRSILTDRLFDFSNDLGTFLNVQLHALGDDHVTQLVIHRAGIVGVVGVIQDSEHQVVTNIATAMHIVDKEYRVIAFSAHRQQFSDLNHAGGGIHTDAVQALGDIQGGILRFVDGIIGNNFERLAVIRALGQIFFGQLRIISIRL